MDQLVKTQINVANELAPRSEKVAPSPEPNSLFEHFAWLYIFCREHIFRDDTQRIIDALWQNDRPAPGTRLLELGCGPGFYSCRLAKNFGELSVLGVDRSPRQLDFARDKARSLELDNCRFEGVNVLALSQPDETFDVAITSRLFTVLTEPARAVSEIYRVLQPGGRCFIAEPRHAFWASIPLFAMWFIAKVSGFKNGYCEPTRAIVLSPEEFKKLFADQPWKNVKVWQDGHYQYALCEKR